MGRDPMTAEQAFPALTRASQDGDDELQRSRGRPAETVDLVASG